MRELCRTLTSTQPAPTSSMLSSCRDVELSSIEGVPLASSIAICIPFPSMACQMMSFMSAAHATTSVISATARHLDHDAIPSAKQQPGHTESIACVSLFSPTGVRAVCRRHGILRLHLPHAASQLGQVLAPMVHQQLVRCAEHTALSMQYSHDLGLAARLSA